MKFINKFRKIYLFSAIAVIGVLFFFFSSLKAQTGCDPNSHNVRGWGWNPYIGWISLNCGNTEAPSPGVDYGVNVDIYGHGVTGYAWSGWGPGYWICFGSTCTGTPPEGGLGANYNSTSGQITGWAKLIGWGYDGWIKLSGSNGGTKFFGDQNQGTFGQSPATNNSSWAWNSAIGWIQWKPVAIGCECEWRDVSCGTHGCLSNERYQQEICTPSDCRIEDTRCVDDDSCQVPQLGTPVLEASSEECGNIKLTWDAVSGASYYKIYKTLTSDGCNCLENDSCNFENGNCYEIEETYSESLEYIDTAIIPRINYYYRIIAVIISEEEELKSGPSNYDSARTVCFPGTEWREE